MSEKNLQHPWTENYPNTFCKFMTTFIAPRVKMVIKIFFLHQKSYDERIGRKKIFVRR